MRKRKPIESRRKQLSEGLFDAVLKMISKGKVDQAVEKLEADPNLQKAIEDVAKARSEFSDATVKMKKLLNQYGKKSK